MQCHYQKGSGHVEAMRIPNFVFCKNGVGNRVSSTVRWILMDMRKNFRPLWCRSTWMCGTQQSPNKIQMHSVNSKCNVPSRFLTIFRSFRQFFLENSITIIIVIHHELGFNRTVSAPFNSLLKGHPSHLHPLSL